MCELGGMNVAFRVPLDGVSAAKACSLNHCNKADPPHSSDSSRRGCPHSIPRTGENTIACTNKHRYAVVDNNKVHLLKN